MAKLIILGIALVTLASCGTHFQLGNQCKWESGATIGDDYEREATESEKQLSK